jgi:hypothetical protein
MTGGEPDLANRIQRCRDAAVPIAERSKAGAFELLLEL